MKIKLLILAALLLAVADYAHAQYALIRHVKATVTTASSTVLAAPTTTRKLLYLENDSDTTIYCNFHGDTATVNAGGRLNASGGSFWWDQPGTIPATAINCIHGGTGNKTLLIGIGE